MDLNRMNNSFNSIQLLIVVQLIMYSNFIMNTSGPFVGNFPTYIAMSMQKSLQTIFSEKTWRAPPTNLLEDAFWNHVWT